MRALIDSAGAQINRLSGRLRGVEFSTPLRAVFLGGGGGRGWAALGGFLRHSRGSIATVSPGRPRNER